MAHCHLLMEQRRYAMAAKIIDFELDDWKKWKKMWIMASKTHKVTLGRPKNRTSWIVGRSVSPQKKLTFFTVIATKPVEIVFEQNIDNIK